MPLWAESGFLVSAKLTRDILLDRRDGVAVMLSRRWLCCGWGIAEDEALPSCCVRPIVSSTPSASDSVSSSSSSSSLRSLPDVMRKTPKKVRRQPPTNLAACFMFVFSKSRYRTALPMMTHSVNMTNWMGMTWVESKRDSALLT